MTTATKKDQHIHVCETLAGLSVVVDRESGIIRGVKAVGFEAKNGRYYPPETLRAAVHKYEGVKVNVDHPESDKPNRPRGVAERFGVLKNARFVEGQGVIADLHFNPKHALAEQVSWDAENNPSAVGLSHNAMVRYAGRKSNGRRAIAEVADVKSVDLVADPATTNGIFESINEPETVSENEDMDFSNLTLADLKSKRPDLVQSLESEQSEGAEAAKMTAALEAATKKIEAYEAKEAVEKKTAEIRDELEAVGFDPTNKHADKKRHVSDTFLKTLVACESVEDRKELIEDRKELVGEWKEAPKPGQKPTTTPITEGAQLSSDDWLKRIRS